MELFQLKQFLYVAEYENMTTAADLMYLSQPSISVTISKLENELGHSLFDRPTGKSLKINKYGRIVQQYALEIFNLLDRMNAEIQESINFDEERAFKTFRFSENNSLFSSFLLPYFFLEGNDIRFRKIEGGNMEDEQLKMLRSDKIDFGIFDYVEELEGSAKGAPEIKCIRMPSAKLYVSVPNSNPLSARKALTYKDLYGQPFIKNPHDESNVIDAKNDSNLHPENWLESDYFGLSVIARDSSTPVLYFVTSYQIITNHDLWGNNDYRTAIEFVGSELNSEMYFCYLEKNEEKMADFIEWVKNFSSRGEAVLQNFTREFQS